MIKLFITLLLLFFSLQFQQIECFGTVQSSSVKGNLMCNGKPSVNTKVKLFDQDSKIKNDNIKQIKISKFLCIRNITF